jgi:hypothetical protein
LSVSQPEPRLFATIGARRNSAGGVNAFKLVADSAISLILSNRNISRGATKESSPRRKPWENQHKVEPHRDDREQRFESNPSVAPTGA